MTSTNLIVPVIINAVLATIGSGYSLAILLPRQRFPRFEQDTPIQMYSGSRQLLLAARGGALSLAFLVIGITGLLDNLGVAPRASIYSCAVVFLIMISVLTGLIAQIRLMRA